ncbi:hypothetical protein HanXRQr2_Chr01g0031361 [Helianthus annuus]|uniref:Uncharacterized protein n=2 Tax=Helianthus annuus TaxID=4232 RepID=A0A251VQ93_HELAN|nr:hypothetical protein HanXRQr2_Chr01g0031361 [Helianthus annuus]KAJ0957694.1 hypothetical protein HanPSC8_Chr01g0030621 [Helianthus annuus]
MVGSSPKHTYSRLDQLHPQWHHNAFMTFEKVPDQMFLPCSICAQRSNHLSVFTPNCEFNSLHGSTGSFVC